MIWFIVFKWILLMFDLIDLQYEDKCFFLICLLDKFISCFKKIVGDFDENIFEEIKKKIVFKVNKYWNFEIDINIKEIGKIIEVLEILNNVSEIEDEEELIRYLKCVLLFVKGD